MRRNGLLASIAVLLLALTAWADVTGSIAGTVTDAAGAVVPGAAVTATNDATGLSSSTVTDGRGHYAFLALPVGRYRLEVRRSGFQIYRQTDIVLNVNATLRIDVALHVGAVTQTVEVAANAVHVETANTQMGDVIESPKMEAVPLNGRSYLDLLGLQPGVMPLTTGDSASVSGNLSSGNVSVSGQRGSANGFMVNGGSVEEGRTNGAAIIPNLDSIAEFRLLTNSFDAEYGHFSGGLVNAITKSGTNRYHGDAFGFFRNQNLDANDFFSNQTGAPRGAFSRKQFGGTLGGPIKHDKVFFFADYQGTRESRGTSAQTPVPTAAQRGGDVSNMPQDGTLTGSVNGPYWANLLSQRLGYTVTAGEPYYNPGCTTATCVFPGQIIPAAAIVAPATALMKYIPLPNATGQDGTPLFSTTALNTDTRDDKGGVRIDANSRFGLLSAYYFIDNAFVTDPYASATLPGFAATTPSRAQQLVLSDTKAFGATAVNEFRASFMRTASVANQPQGGLGPKLSSLGFGSNLVPVVPKYEGVPETVTNNFNIGVPEGTTGQYDNVFEFLDNFSKVAGAHTIKFGGEFHYTQINERNTYAENGLFSFDGSETGNDWADFLIGAPGSFTQSSQQFLDSRTFYDGWYAEDSWRARPDLTVNYGLRWEVSTPFYDTGGKIESIVPGEQSVVFPGAPTGWVFPGDPGIPKTLSPVRWNNFAPRLGLAYSPNATSGPLAALFGPSGHSSLRASWGMFYTAVEDNTLFYEVGDAPYGLFYSSSTPPLFDQPYVDRASGFNEGQRFPFTPPVPGDRNIDWAQYLPISSAPGVVPTNRLPYAEHYSLSYERELSSSTVLNLAYVGTQGHRLIAFLEANPGNPALCLSLSQPNEVADGITCGPNGENTVYTRADGTIVNGTRGPLGNDFGSNQYQDTMANSSYNALEASVRHTGHRDSFLAAYTYSKSLDNASSYSQWINPLNFRDSRALSSFDMTHNFVVSYSYLLPFDKLADHPSRLLDGWQLTGVTRFTTGLPITLRQSGDHSLLGTSGVDAPDFNGGQLTFRDPRSGQTWFDTSLFSSEPLGQIGTANRRFFHGPGIENFDLALLKDVSLGESRSVQMRAEFFNAFNHAQFMNPSGNFSSSFGVIRSTRDPRIGQLAIKYIF